jgi:hypothetical protein
VEGQDFGLEVRDYAGRTVRLDHQNWVEHLRRRPEISPYHGSLGPVLTHPNVVLETDRGVRCYFRLGVGQEPKLQGMYFLVMVGIADGMIRTAYFTRRPEMPGSRVVYLERG